ncbi:hypothetical protein J2S22_001164 [Rhodoplanes tepidamans]|nr:hypothetical protein [Rhodoplanes tepidamans]
MHTRRLRRSAVPAVLLGIALVGVALVGSAIGIPGRAGGTSLPNEAVPNEAVPAVAANPVDPRGDETVPSGSVPDPGTADGATVPGDTAAPGDTASLENPAARAEEPEAADGLISADTILASIARVDAAASADEPPSSVYGRVRLRLSLAGYGVGAGIYRPLIEAEARLAGMPAEVAEAVMGVESSYNPRTVGAVGEIGLMQVLPSTARMMGFTGTLEQLAVPEINIHYGVRYLAQAWSLAGGDLCTAVMKYRAGHGERRFSYRSVDYCLKVRARLAARGHPVIGSVPVATFGEPVGACGTCGRGARRGAAADYAEINARLDRAVARLSGKTEPER